MYIDNNINSWSHKKFIIREMCLAEANYLKAPQNTIFRQRLQKIFKNNQHTFDKSFKF